MASREIGLKPTVEIGGKVIEVEDVSFDPGNVVVRQNFNHKESALYLERCSPSISLDGVSPADFSLREANHVRLVFATRKRWKFPVERFVTYEPSDEDWCRYFGIGQEVDVTPIIDMPRAYVDAADYDRVRFVGAASQENVDVTF